MDHWGYCAHAQISFPYSWPPNALIHTSMSPLSVKQTLFDLAQSRVSHHIVARTINSSPSMHTKRKVTRFPPCHHQPLPSLSSPFFSTNNVLLKKYTMIWCETKISHPLWKRYFPNCKVLAGGYLTWWRYRSQFNGNWDLELMLNRRVTIRIRAGLSTNNT